MRLLCFSAMVVLSGCRIHTLDDGPYSFVTTEVLRDDCSIDGTGVIGAATLRTEGNLVSLALAKPELRLVGTYRFSVEEMTLDGNLTNYQAILRGRECLLDTVNLHVDTVTTSPTSFTGAMSINYEARQPDECVCKYWFKFTATHQ